MGWCVDGESAGRWCFGGRQVRVAQGKIKPTLAGAGAPRQNQNVNGRPFACCASRLLRALREDRVFGRARWACTAAATGRPTLPPPDYEEPTTTPVPAADAGAADAV